MKPHLLLLPGLMGDAAVWQPQCEALAARAQCQVIDYGTLDSLTAMAEKALAEAKAERFALAGHSMGGRVAFEIMRLAPHRVTHLALLDTSYHPLPDGAAGQAERDGRMALLELARREGMRVMGRRWAEPMVHPDRIDTPMFDALLAMLERSSPDIYAAQVRALLNRRDAEPLLAQIACPTLLLCGREDRWSPPSRHEHMRHTIPRSSLIVLDHCGHMATMEQPQAVALAMSDWLH